jgi:hypothetical protein
VGDCGSATAARRTFVTRVDNGGADAAGRRGDDMVPVNAEIGTVDIIIAPEVEGAVKPAEVKPDQHGANYGKLPSANVSSVD